MHKNQSDASMFTSVQRNYLVRVHKGKYQKKETLSLSKTAKHWHKI